MNNDLLNRFTAKKLELQETGELASAIDYDDQGQWVGLLVAKNFPYTDLEDQIHWAISVTNQGIERLLSCADISE